MSMIYSGNPISLAGNTTTGVYPLNNSVEQELQQSYTTAGATAAISMNDAAVRTMSNTISNATISMRDFYQQRGNVLYRIYNSPASGGTETIPSWATTVVIDCWGAGGGGGGTTGSGMGITRGGGGGPGGYCRTVVTGSAIQGKTLTFKIGAAGVGSSAGVAGTAGAASNVVSGTLTITTMSATGGGGGKAGGGVTNFGSPGVGSGGTANNQTPANGTTGIASGAAGYVLYPNTTITVSNSSVWVINIAPSTIGLSNSIPATTGQLNSQEFYIAPGAVTGSNTTFQTWATVDNNIFVSTVNNYSQMSLSSYNTVFPSTLTCNTAFCFYGGGAGHGALLAGASGTSGANGKIAFYYT